MKHNSSKRALFFATIFCTACEEDPNTNGVEMGSEDPKDIEDPTCEETLTMFRADGFCPPETHLIIGQGELDPIPEPEFERVEFEKGYYQRGYDSEAGELFYMDESCMIACRRSQAVTQPAICEGIDEEGNSICTYGSALDFTPDACAEFIDACS